MMEPSLDPVWERSLEATAQRLEYPPTPDIAAAVGLRLGTAEDRGARRPANRLAWALLIIGLFFLGLLAVPQTRAAVLRLVAQIGAIRVFVDEAGPAQSPSAEPIPTVGTLPPTGTRIPGAEATAGAPAMQLPPTAALPAHSLDLRALGQAATLDEAEDAMAFPVKLPAALKSPDETYLHRTFDEAAVTFVWRDERDGVLTLTEVGVPEFAFKLVAEEQVSEVTVGGRPALWIEGPHSLQITGGWSATPLRIESNVLLWAADGVTYRLEGDILLKDAQDLAESLAAPTG